MKIPPLTEWEKRERAGLLALETPAWREKRLTAENPNTTGDVLGRLEDELYAAWDMGDDEMRKPTHLLAEALAAHPNTPLWVLDGIIGRSPFTFRAFCRNSITPFLLLERPAFVAEMAEEEQHGLLSESSAPPLFVHLLATGGAAQSEDVEKAGRLHIAFGGEVTTQKEWQQQISDYWRAELAGADADLSGADAVQQWHIDFAELGLAPRWAMGSPPIPEPDPPLYYPVLDEWFRFAHALDSPEEASLLTKIGPKLKQSILARGLRRDAIFADRRDLLHSVPSAAVWMALLRHPSVDAELIREMASLSLYHVLLAPHPLTPPDVLVKLLQSKSPMVRRLARSHPNAPSDAFALSRRAAVSDESGGKSMSKFTSFVCCLYSLDKPDDLTERAEDPLWTKRIEAALLADTTDAIVPNDPYKRSGLDLLHYLARDGNRLVRWAAQTRLADPNFAFAWQDDE